MNAGDEWRERERERERESGKSELEGWHDNDDDDDGCQRKTSSSCHLRDFHCCVLVDPTIILCLNAIKSCPYITIVVVNIIDDIYGGARGVMVIVAGYGHGDTSSNPGPDWLHFT